MFLGSSDVLNTGGVVRKSRCRQGRTSAHWECTAHVIRVTSCLAASFVDGGKVSVDAGHLKFQKLINSDEIILSGLTLGSGWRCWWEYFCSRAWAMNSQRSFLRKCSATWKCVFHCFLPPFWVDFSLYFPSVCQWKTLSELLSAFLRLILITGILLQMQKPQKGVNLN